MGKRDKSSSPDRRRSAKRKRHRSDSKQLDDKKRKKSVLKKRKDRKSQKRRRSSSSSSSSSSSRSSSSSSSSSSSRERRERRRKEKKRKKKKHKLKKLKDKAELLKLMIGPAKVDAKKEEDDAGPSKAKSMRPMTKEEWEKQQSVIRHVYDPETGRTRLIKGDGEVLEEIVSKEKQREINKRATQGDGLFFASRMGIQDR